MGPADGAIYGIPQCADSVLRIDPATQSVTTIGTLPPGGHKWHGGVVGRDGCIYGIPANADSVRRASSEFGSTRAKHTHPLVEMAEYARHIRSIYI